ncbi:DUF4339 domain-containing protein [Coraliomargarita akajimensis]|uniref:GYF domain-containing protein n=1 Tax=Coraliomargarita akajimensis (strain DSM 45221 / IAM 15411 / JCM 23193 / KCTC 12865 / 04OKA010-24) TaxID=583355 RepID=D5EIH6_CORAD|nr:DUF4339 domain-containing protein [Coraliomargarita akajimensis]ADE54242.1 hypothetical protein Caka_1222 [Coraliomargarita akajimensis DSM 45221]
MKWFYVREGQQAGPVEESELRSLIDSGTLAEQTPVWRQGMTDWKPFDEVLGRSKRALAPPLREGHLIACPSCGVGVTQSELIPAGDQPICPNCRDRYLQCLQEGVSADFSNDCAVIRQQHIKHEASIRSVGLLYYIGALFMLLVAVGMLIGFGASFGGSQGDASTFLLIAGLAYLLFGTAAVIIGRGLRRLRRSIRVPVTILSCLGLLSIPIGTVINAYILYLLHSEKGKTVFSDEYADIVTATPEIKYRTSALVWILLAIVLLILLAAIVIPVVGV